MFSIYGNVFCNISYFSFHYIPIYFVFVINSADIYLEVHLNKLECREKVNLFQ